MLTIRTDRSSAAVTEPGRAGGLPGVLTAARQVHRPVLRGRTRYASSGEVRIAYELRGTLHRRRPWLVLVQGMGFDRSGWGTVRRKRGPHFPVVLVDNRGFGGSGRPVGLFAVADMAGD